MNLNHLRYFIETVKWGSLNKASQNLYITQPTLSKALNSLEAELDAQLIIRSKQGIALTEIGKKIYADAIDINNTLESWNEYIQNQKKNLCTIRFVSTNSFCNTIGVDIFENFSFQNHDISVIQQEIQRKDFLSYLHFSKSDVLLFTNLQSNMVTLLPIIEREHFVAETIYTDSIYATFSANSKLATQKEIYLEDLKDTALVIGTNSRYHENINLTQLLQCYCEYLPKKSLEYLPSTESIYRLISSSDDYIALMTGFTVFNNNYYKNGLVRVAKIDYHPDYVYHYLLHRDGKHITKQEISLCNFIKRSYYKHIDNIIDANIACIR